MTISVKKLPTIPQPRGPLVLALVYDGLCNFEFACAAEVFGLTRPEFAGDWYRFETCAVKRKAITGQYGMRLTPDAGLERMRDAANIIIPGWCTLDEAPQPELIDALCAAHRRGATLISICSGVFVLAATGLLDGQRATTHWLHTQKLQQRFARVEVDPAVLYIDNGRTLTSAGSAAGLDLCLHIVRRDYGPGIANQVARRLVVAPHRDGGQAQFVKRSVDKHPRTAFSNVLERMRGDLASERSIAQWAQATAMSERTFLRRFRESTGMTPGEYLAMIRLDHARELLETRDMPIDLIALECGFGSAATLRHHFRSKLGITPTAYRSRFRQRRTAANG